MEHRHRNQKDQVEIFVSFFREFHSFSKTSLSLRSSTVNPAFLASVVEKGLVILGVLILLITFFTGFLQSGHEANVSRSTGRRSSKPFAQILQLFVGSS